MVLYMNGELFTMVVGTIQGHSELFTIIAERSLFAAIQRDALDLQVDCIKRDAFDLFIEGRKSGAHRATNGFLLEVKRYNQFDVFYVGGTIGGILHTIAAELK